MFFCTHLFFFASGQFLGYNLFESAGQLVADEYNPSTYGIVGSTLLIESSDPVLTDRGGYFENAQYIQLNPNFISSSVPNLQSNLVFLILFKVIDPGVIFSMYVSNSLEMEVSYDSGNLKFTRNGSTVFKAVSPCNLYIAIWVTATIGYLSYAAGNCANSGLIIKVDGICESLPVSSYTISWSINSQVRFGDSSSGFKGFLGLFYVYGDFDTPNSMTLGTLSSNTNLYSTSLSVPCDCGTYSCDSDTYNICIMCDSTCGDFCIDYTSAGCLDINLLCGSKVYSSTLGICVTPISHCSVQASDTICSLCEDGYYLYSDNTGCGACYGSCTLCTGPLLNDCDCIGTNAHFDTTLEECVCDEGFYQLNIGADDCLGVCDVTCLTCTGSANNQCTSCTSPKILVDGVCTTESPICNTSCETCAGLSSNDCLTCQDPNAYVKNPPDKCICKQNYFLDTLTSTCEICSSTCQTCTNSATFCLSCIENYTLTTNNTCINCESGFFYNDGICNECHDSCNTCVNSSESACITCQDSTIVIGNPPGSCLCEKSQYVYQNSPLLCKNCPEGCLSCDSLECFECYVGYSLNSSFCLKNELNVELKLNSNFSISVIFSKDLESDLQSKDILITIQNKSVEFKLTKIKEDKYLINLQSVPKTSKKLQLNIEFTEKILGADYSELKEFTHLLILPAESNQISVLDRIKKYGILAILLLAFILCFTSVFTNTQATLLWIAFNTLQIVSYVPLFNIPMTSTLRNFFMSTLPLSVFINIWSVFEIINCENSEIPSTYYDYGYTCHNILINTGEVFFGLLCGIAFFIILLPLRYVFTGRFKKFAKAKISDYKYSFFFRFWIQSFLDVSVPAGLSLNFISVDNKNDILNLIFGVFLSALIIVTPLLTIWIIKKNYQDIRSDKDKVVKMFSPLIKDFKYYEDIRVLAYYPLFFIRRIIFSVTAYCLLKFPFIQIGISCFFTLITIIFYAKYRPYKESYINFIVISQEIVTFIIFALLSLFLFPSLQTYNTVWTYLIIGCSGALFLFSLLIGMVICIKKIIQKFKQLNLHPQRIRITNEKSQSNLELNNNIKITSKSKASVIPFSLLHPPCNSAIVSPFSSFDIPSK